MRLMEMKGFESMDGQISCHFFSYIMSKNGVYLSILYP